MPDLLLTAFYRLDPKTGRLAHDVMLKFQPNGPSDCQLNFPHSSLSGSNYPLGTHVYEFNVDMDLLYNSETVLSRKGGTVGGSVEGSVEGNVGVAKASGKATANGSYEMGKQFPDTRTTLHGQITGRLDAYAHRPDMRLTASGVIFGSPNIQRTK